MKERPILFSSSMVRALLAGKKTQTRRLVKSQPMMGMVAGRPDLGTGWIWQNGKARFNNPCDEKELADAMATHKGVCPYGVPGDRLWVKETWRTAADLDAYSPTTIAQRCLDAGYERPWAPMRYEADGHHIAHDGWTAEGKTRVSIHMPRWASRITLAVKAVRVERLNDISEEDARAEGVRWQNAAIVVRDGEIQSEMSGTCRGAFACLWDSINGDRAPFASNPWVWVVSFERVATKGSAE